MALELGHTGLPSSLALATNLYTFESKHLKNNQYAVHCFLLRNSLSRRAPRPHAVRGRKAAPVGLRRVASCPGTRTPHVTLRPGAAARCLGTATQPGSREPREGTASSGRGRYAAPGSDVTARHRPRRPTLGLLVPVSAVARTNLILSQGIDSFFSTGFITREFLRNGATISSLPSR